MRVTLRPSGNGCRNDFPPEAAVEPSVENGQSAAEGFREGDGAGTTVDQDKTTGWGLDQHRVAAADIQYGDVQ